MSWRKSPHDTSKHGELPAESDIAYKHKLVGVVALATISAIFLLAVALVVASCFTFPQFVDNPDSPSSSVTRSVGATRLQSICPIRLSLPDSTKYGDSQYQESEGDLQSFARYGAFGDVYKAGVQNIRDNNDETESLLTKAEDSETSSLISNSSVDHDAQALEGRLSKVVLGTGIAASMASWATFRR